MNRDHDNDTPDTVISSSSPECVIPEFPIRFPGMVINLSVSPLDANCISWWLKFFRLGIGHLNCYQVNAHIPAYVAIDQYILEVSMCFWCTVKVHL